jgi:serine/threonine protein kinase
MTASAKKRVGRYEIYAEIASGGMATVHFGRQLGHVGFARAVAIKRLHPHIARDPSFVSMFLDEARLATRIRHPNVVPTLDVVAAGGELILVMEYIHGESLARLLGTMAARKERVDPRVAVSIGVGMLEGLHAAHEAKNERGVPLEIVHRDVSPQNVLVGVDGVARVFDFGIAKAVDRLHTTQDGSLKGKIAYMSPEQLDNEPVDRRTDVWAASVVLWEALAGRRLFVADSQAALIRVIMTKDVPPPSSMGSPPELDAVLARGLEKDPDERYATAREMAAALEDAFAGAAARGVARWVEEVAKSSLESRVRLLDAIDRGAADDRPSGSTRVEVDAFLGGEIAAPPSAPAFSPGSSMPSMPAVSPRARAPSGPGAATLQFTVLGELAVGGMGRVDLARCADGDVGLGLVAVKRLLPVYAMDPDFVRMFESEALLTGAIHHPNIVGLVGYGTDAEGLFLATELVLGGSLSQLETTRKRLKDKPKVEIVAYVGACVAAALAAAHSAKGEDGELLQMIHRDVSLGNVLVSVRGEIKLADFGVAKACVSASQTAAGILKGKVHYLAPEYVRGEAVNWQSDLFSLGVLLYQLACGVRPFEGASDPEVIHRILTSAPEPLLKRAPTIDPALAAIIERLLSRDPARRSPGGAAALAAELEASMAARGQRPDEVARVVGAYAERYGIANLARIRDLECGPSEDTDIDATPHHPTGLPALPAPPKMLKVTLTGATRPASLAVTWPRAPLQQTVLLPPPSPAFAATPPAATAPAMFPPAPVSRASSRAVLVAVGAAATLLVFASVYTFTHRARPAVLPVDTQTAPDGLMPTAVAMPMPMPVPLAARSGTAAPAVSLVPSATATAAPIAPTSHVKGKPPRAGSVAPATTARCTSFDFDYPACLKR